MKKHNAHHSNDRRKKTNAEMSADRARRQVIVQQEEQRSKPRWEDLNGVLNSCRELLGNVRPVAGLLANKELIEKAGDDVIKLRDMASILNRDVGEYVSALNAIAEQHKDKTGIIENDTDLILMFNIGEQYHQWSASYESVVVSSIRDIFALINQYLPESEKVG